MSAAHRLALRCHVARLWRFDCTLPSSRAQLLAPAAGLNPAGRSSVDCQASRFADAMTRTLATNAVLGHKGDANMPKTIFDKDSIVVGKEAIATHK